MAQAQSSVAVSLPWDAPPTYQQTGLGSPALRLGSQWRLFSDEAIPRGRILRLIFPSNGQLRARKVVTRSRARCTIKYPSIKAGRALQAESVHERNAFLLIDAFPQFISVSEQPCAIEFELGGTFFTHFPDILVCTRTKSELWEIKERSEAQRPKTCERTLLLEHELPRLGYSYRVVLAEDLKVEPLLSNARIITRFGRSPVPIVRREALRLLWKQHGTVDWRSVISGQLGPHTKFDVCSLIVDGTIALDLSQQLTPDTPLTWATEM